MFKKISQLIVLSMFLTFVLASHVMSAPANLQSSAAIDWDAGYIEVKGIGAPPANQYDTAVAAELARQSAITDAHRLLSETIKGIQLGSNKTVGDLVKSDDVINLKLSAFLRSVSISSERSVDNNYHEVILRVNLYGNSGLEGIIPEILTAKPAITPAAPEPKPVVQELKPVAPELKPTPIIVPAPVIEDKVPAITKFQWTGRKNDHDYFALQLVVPEPTDVAWIQLIPSEYSGAYGYYSYSDLYVYFKGTRISHRGSESLGVFTDTSDLELNVYHQNDWKPGKKFLVQIAFANGSRLVQVATLGSSAPESVIPSSNKPVKYYINEFKHIDNNQDRVGSGLKGMPDGKNDNHFLLTMTLPNSTEISSMTLYTTNERGEIYPSSHNVWSTRDVNHWVLGVVHQNKQLNYNHVDSLGVFSGKVEFDLFANIKNTYDKQFLVEVTFADGSRNSAYYKVVNYD